MNQSSPSLVRRVAAVILLSLLSCAVPAQAANLSWAGVGGNELWNTTTNWVPSSIPQAYDTVVFDFLGTPFTTVDLNGNREVSSLVFANSSDYSIISGGGDSNGAFRLTLGSGNLTASGTGSLDLSSITLGSNGIWDISNTVTVNGRIGGNKRLSKQGGGTLLLTGGTLTSSSTLSTLASIAGEVIVDGGRLDLTNTLFTDGGNIQLRGGAVVEMTAIDAVGIINNDTLTVTGNGTSLIGGRLDAGEISGDTGSIVVQNDASVALTADLIIGFQGVGELTVQTGGQVSSVDVLLGINNSNASTALVTGSDSRLIITKDLGLGGQTPASFGGTGELTVSDGGLAEVQGRTRFFTSSSSISVDGGTLKTDAITELSGVLGTIRIADGTGGTALTIGTNNASSTFNGLIEDFNSKSGSLEKVGSGSLTLNGSNTYSGTTTISGGKVIVGNTNALQNSTVSIDVNDGLDVTTNAINANIGALAGAGNLNLGSTRLSVGTNGDSTTYAGILTGTSGSELRKQGHGSLILTGGTTANPSTFGTLRSAAGEVIVDGGSLDLTSNFRAEGGDIQLRNGAVIKVLTNNTVGTVNNSTLTVADDGSVFAGRRLNVAVNSSQTGNIVVNNNASVVIIDALTIGLSGIGDLAVQTGGDVFSEDIFIGINNSNASTVLVTGANSHLTAGSNLSLGGQSESVFGGTGELTVSDGGLVEIREQTQFFTSSSRITVDGGRFETNKLTELSGVLGTIRIADATGGTALTVGTNDDSSTFNGLIEDFDSKSGSLEKVGRGSLTLNGSNTYSGTTTISGGKVIVGDANALQNSTVSIDVNDGLDVTTNAINANIGALAGTGNLNLGSTRLTAGANDDSTTYSGILTGTSDSVLRKQGNGSLLLTGGTAANPSTFGSLQSSGGELIVDGGHLDLTDDDLFGIRGDIQLRNGAVVEMTASNAFGIINNSTLTLTGNGTSFIGARLDAGNIATQTGSIVVQNEASLALSSFLIIGFDGIGDLTVQSGGQVSSKDLSLGIKKSSGSTALVTGADSRLIATNTLILGGQSTTGDGMGELTVSDGGLVEIQGRTEFLSSISSITVDGGTFKTGQLTQRGGVNGLIRIADAPGETALTVGTNNGSSTFNGSIRDINSIANSGSGSIAKVGSGTLTLNGDNTYSGGTTINGGTLLANNAIGSATGSGSVDVNDGATLGGNGAIAGTVNVNSGGTLGPGNSPGSLEVASVFFDTGAIFNVEIGGLLADTEYDVLNVLGDANLAGILSVDLIDLGGGQFSPELGDSFDILTAVQLLGEFEILSLAVLDAGLKWNVEYLTDFIGFTDIVRLSVVNNVAAVPVPATVWLFASGLLGLISVQRKRNRV